MPNLQLENNYTYHAPNPEQQSTYVELRETAKKLAYLIEANCPKSRETSLAHTKLEETIMWANAAIARYPSS